MLHLSITAFLATKHQSSTDVLLLMLWQCYCFCAEALVYCMRPNLHLKINEKEL